MPKPDQRQELIDELNKEFPFLNYFIMKGQKNKRIKMTDNNADILADFIISDRKRVCRPLVKFRGGRGNEFLAIKQTLKLAGLE